MPETPEVDSRLANITRSPASAADDCMPHAIDEHLARWLAAREGPDGLAEVLRVVESGRWAEPGPGMTASYRLSPPARFAAKRRAAELLRANGGPAASVIVNGIEWRPSADGTTVVARLRQS